MGVFGQHAPHPYEAGFFRLSGGQVNISPIPLGQVYLRYVGLIRLTLQPLKQFGEHPSHSWDGFFLRLYAL